jgi:type IV pilus assembly protein PilA
MPALRCLGKASIEPRLRQRSRGQGGYSLIELLLVILIIGILAAIAIPSLLSHKSRANAAQAKELARTAETTAETISTDSGGTYEKVSLAELHKYEQSIVIAESKTEAYLSNAEGRAKTFSVTAKDVTGEAFTIERSAEGVITRSCEPVKAGTGCASGRW